MKELLAVTVKYSQALIVLAKKAPSQMFGWVLNRPLVIR